jgi:catechol 2,3-dioxygenase-like lactoylglutathione lyase family enzyme
MSETADWYTRPVWGVSDIQRSLEFYVGKLGFREDWRHAEQDRPLIVQVSRPGCELVLSAQWPERLGQGLIFVSLDVNVLEALRAELTARKVAVTDGWWGYRLMVVQDADGNTLYFPYPDFPYPDFPYPDFPCPAEAASQEGDA